MRRALQLARYGYGHTSPNPMVGAVIVHDGRIIGEGYHRRIGGPHAEVWAVRSVAEADRHLIPQSVLYVTLEPCSHYGKTPPCARMLVEQQIGGVVVGCTDPNPRVSGRGIAILREAGIPVVTGVLEQECRELNRPFMIAQTHRRPYVLLKWAQSADGFMGRRGADGKPHPIGFSTPLTRQLMHRLRASVDAIMVGSGTVIADNPRLDVRGVEGSSPRPVVIDRRGIVPADARVFSRTDAIYVSSVLRSDLPQSVERLMVGAECSLAVVLRRLKTIGVGALMVEGGSALLDAFIKAGEWDDARIEISPAVLGGEGYGYMDLPHGIMRFEPADAGNMIINVKNCSTCGKQSI